MTLQAKLGIGAGILALGAVFVYGAQVYFKSVPEKKVVQTSEPVTTWNRGGLWAKRRSGATRATSSPTAIALQSLPYLTGVRPKHSAAGVMRYDPKAVYQGYNLYCSGHAPEAILMDMEGKTLHQYKLDRAVVWPEFAKLDAATERREREEWVERNFRKLHLFEDGDLLAIYDDTGIVRIDACSNVVWARRYNSHHDLDIDEEGNLYVLGKDFDKLGRPREEIEGHPLRERFIDGERVLDEFIDVMTLSGELTERISLIDCFENSSTAIQKILTRTVQTMRAPVKPAKRPNPLHTNSLRVLTGDYAHRSSAFAKGNILLSFRTPSLIAIINPKSRRIVWMHRGPFRVQHDARFTAKGTIMLFNNFLRPEHSQVLEFDPLSKKVVWEYSAKNGDAFFSQFQGASRRLPNGNTLIVESCQGRAFEVTADKRIVWDYLSPHTVGSDEQIVAVVPEVLRIPLSVGEGVLRAAKRCRSQPVGGT